MRKSLLFIPANLPSMVQNYEVFDADAVIFDLEDTIVNQEKDAARDLLESWLTSDEPTRVEVILRINPIQSPFFQEDLKLLKLPKITTLMIPKVNQELLMKTISAVREYANHHQIQKTFSFIPIVETAKGVLDMEAMAKTPHVTALLLGAEDLVSDMNILRSKDGKELLFVRSKMALVAHAYNIDAIDTPYLNIHDEEGLIRETRMARDLGMTGKACIHPNDISAIAQIFFPTQQEIDEAERIVRACESVDPEVGVMTLDGKMIDITIYHRAKKLLSQIKHVRRDLYETGL